MTLRQTLIALALAIILAGCSNTQLRHMADSVCRGLENCTVYDEDGNPSNRDWDPPINRR